NMRGRPRALTCVLAAASALGALPASGALSSAPARSAPSAVVTGPPRNISPPQLFGIARVGLALTASHGSWSGLPTSFAYRWRRCDASGASCAPIAGATARSYTIRAGDLGKRLRVIVVASNAAGSSAPARSAPSAVVTGPPRNISPPQLFGIARVGLALTASHGSWSGLPTSFAYRWRRCDASGASCAPIAGATARSYTIRAGDLGKRLRGTVEATYAPQSPPAPTAFPSTALFRSRNISPPQLFGIARVGLALTASHGSWSGLPTSFAYRWRRCDASGASCAPIAGATARSYTIRAGDLGKRLRVIVVASNAAGSSAPARSAPSAVVTGPPRNISPPQLFGIARVGLALTASHGSWSGLPTSFAYRWRRCDASGASCAPIAGATARSYTIRAGDLGKRLRGTVEATYAPQSPPAPTAFPSTALFRSRNISPPQLFGIARVGLALTASHGSWSGLPTSFAYRWRRCDASGASCAPIAGATARSYTIRAGDLGKRLRVIVVASNAAGSSAPARSAPSAVVTGPPRNISPPQLFGIARVGLALTASHGSWSGLPTSFAYRWRRCDASGASCAPIAGATARSYTIRAGDLGKRLRGTVEATYAPQSPPAPTAFPSTALFRSRNISPPQLFGIARVGLALTASHGSWSGLPTSFAYRWRRCDASGASCAPIAGATARSYTIRAGDLGKRLRVIVGASNPAGSSAPARTAPGHSRPARSAQTALVTESEEVSHLEYVLAPGRVHVYSIDERFKEVESFSLPDSAGVRGVDVCPAKHAMYVSYGGDGGGNGNGSVLAYDLVGKRLIWNRSYNHGIDSAALTRDCSRLFEPGGENSSSGTWWILGTANGEPLGAVQTPGSGPHDGVTSADGRLILLGDRNYAHLPIYNTATGKLQEQVG